MKSEESDFVGESIKHLKDGDPEQWINSDYLQYVRQNLWQGQQIKECRVCWDKEKNGLQSLRQTYNRSVLGDIDPNKTWAKSFFRDRSPNDYGELIWADIKINNICNYACVMCFPHDSSLIFNQWAADATNEFVIKKLSSNPVYLEEIKENYQQRSGHGLLTWALSQKRLKTLKVLGGEPLLDKKMLDKLESYPNKKNLGLLFVTNGSVDLVQTYQRLKDFKFVNFVVSLEGVGEINDFARDKSDWNIIEKNILAARDVPGLQIGIHHTLQALTLPDLHQLLGWAKDRHIELTVDVLESPDYLSIDSLAPEEIDASLSRIDDRFSNIVALVRDRYQDRSSELKPVFSRYIKWYKNKRQSS